LNLDELLNEREWRRCIGGDDPAEGFAYFCRNYWYIKHPQDGRIKFDLREAQEETIDHWLNNRYSVVLKARQIGFSTVAAAYSFWLTFFFGDRFVVMLSRTEREAAKLLQKSKYGYKFLPDWMKERGPDLVVDNQLKMTFANESAIESLPSGNDPARGESVYLVVVDEMAFLPNPEEAWASIEPIADVGGRVICLSTANGSGNFFHQLWVGAESGNNGFAGLFFPWSAGDRDDDWYESKLKSMPSWQLHQEYPRSAEEAFIKSGNPVFDVDRLVSIETNEPWRGYVHTFSPKHSELRGSGDGEFAVWFDPEPQGVYVIGADVAEGLGHGDYSSAHVVDARSGDVVAHWHGHIEPDLFGELLCEIGWMYNTALLGIENNNHGLTTLKAAQRYSYRNLYRTRKLQKRNPEATETLGWRTTSATKPLAIDELAAAIRDSEIGIYCSRTVGELKAFIRDQNGRTHGSPHDDRVMSLAICWQMLKYVWLPEYRGDQNLPKYSLGWFERFQIDEDSAFQRVPIGAHNARSNR
jgi:hypothetical protein